MIRRTPHASQRDERQEPQFFTAPRLSTATARRAVPTTGTRERLRDYAARSTPVRSVLTPMERRQTFVEAGPLGPFCFSTLLHGALLTLLLWPHQQLSGGATGAEPQVEMVFDQPPTKHSMQGPRSQDQGGGQPAQSTQAPSPQPPSEANSDSAESAPSTVVPTPDQPSAPPLEQDHSAELTQTPPTTAPVTPGHSPSAQAHTQRGHQHHRQTTSSSATSNPFAHPMDLSFNEQPSPRPRHRGRPAGSGGPIDMSLGPLSMNGQINAPFKTRTSIRGVSEDYAGEIDRWIKAHIYYPEEAARNGEDGATSVHVVLDRYGRVKTVRLIGSSGSYSLDAGLTSTFQGSHLPPPPPDMKGDHFEFDMTLNYILIRQ
nr:TonB family protein [uncultured Neokomagataea sp.]